jgi:hypothetical protein
MRGAAVRSEGLDDNLSRSHGGVRRAMMSPLMATSVRRFDAWLRMLAGTALLLALSGALSAQGPRLFSREWYEQFSGPYSQPLEPFRIVGTSTTLARRTSRRT